MPKRAKESESSEPERESEIVKVVDPLACDDSPVTHLIIREETLPEGVI